MSLIIHCATSINIRNETMSAKLAQLRNSTPVRLGALFVISFSFMMAAALSA
jgi:hypothetical protein